MKKIIAAVLLTACAVHAATRLPMHPEKRLDVTLSCDNLNRLAVAGDRILEIYGDEESFTYQTDEQKGQLFIKPLVTETVAATIVTENGHTQDINIKPVPGQAKTVLLKQPAAQSDTPQDAMRQPFQTMMPFAGMYGGFRPAAPFHEQAAAVIKSVAAGFAAPVPDETPQERTAPGFTLRPLAVHRHMSFRCLVYEVENVTSTQMELREHRFYEQGDIALGLRKSMLIRETMRLETLVLAPGEKTVLYVVRP